MPRPRVVLKLAVSLDGRIATRTGASRWITGPESRKRVHELRAKHPGIMVGINTALADDPELTVRGVPGESPTRIVVDSSLRLPTSSKLAQTARVTRTIVVTLATAPRDREEALRALGVDVIRVGATAAGNVDLAQMFDALPLPSVMVEGGAALAGALIEARLVDELHVFVAPILLGPEGRPCTVAWTGPTEPAGAPRIVDPIVETCGADVYVRGAINVP